MEDLNKNTETKESIVKQDDSKKEAAGSTATNVPKVAPKRIRVRTKPNPAPTIVTKSAPVPKVEIIKPKVETPKVSKKEKKAEVKIVVKKAPEKEKAKALPVVENVVLIALEEDQKKPDSVEVIKQKAKKAEEKVDKLKKKVKKAKKKDVKKSKLKSLKEKLNKALKKLKLSIKKLKKTKE